jgi:hypothetical protein
MLQVRFVAFARISPMGMCCVCWTFAEYCCEGNRRDFFALVSGASSPWRLALLLDMSWIYEHLKRYSTFTFLQHLPM